MPNLPKSVCEMWQKNWHWKFAILKNQWESQLTVKPCFMQQMPGSKSKLCSWFLTLFYNANWTLFQGWLKLRIQLLSCVSLDTSGRDISLEGRCTSLQCECNTIKISPILEFILYQVTLGSPPLQKSCIAAFWLHKWRNFDQPKFEFQTEKFDIFSIFQQKLILLDNFYENLSLLLYWDKLRNVNHSNRKFVASDRNLKSRHPQIYVFAPLAG